MSKISRMARVLLLALTVCLLSGGQVNGLNQIRLGCPMTMNPIVPGDSVSIPVYITNDTILVGFSLGFEWDSPFVRVSSVDLSGSALTPQQRDEWIQRIFGPDTLKALFAWTVMGPGVLFAQHSNEVLLFSINVTVLGGATPFCVNFDSVFIPPGAPFSFYQQGGMQVRPAYVDCGMTEVILGGLVCPVSNQPPVAMCHDVSVISDSTCHAYAWIDYGSFDPDSGDTVTLRQVPAGPYPVGTTSVSLIVTDNHGATRTCQAAVLVLPATGCPEQHYAPVALCHDVFIESDSNCHADVSIDNGSYDPDSGSTITLRQVPGGPYHAGITQVSLIATDMYDLSDTCRATVHVLDTIRPVISCPSNIFKQILFGQPGANVFFYVAATDACSASPAIVATPPSGSLFVVGTTAVTAIATDAAGNADTCQFSVQVTEVEHICGDADSDATVDISDAVYLIAYIFSGGPEPNPVAAGDASCDGAVDISDAVYLIAYIFSSGPAPCAACK